jgi:hypothetical protein
MRGWHLAGAENRGHCQRTSLRPEPINDLQKRELMKSADSPNAVFAHENCRMRVMKQITSEMRQL